MKKPVTFKDLDDDIVEELRDIANAAFKKVSFDDLDEELSKRIIVLEVHVKQLEEENSTFTRGGAMVAYVLLFAAIVERFFF